MFKKTIIVFSAVLAVAWGYSAGAPETVCDDMTPKHPVEPKKSPLPYTVSVDRKEAKSGEIIKITIGGKAFKGYFIQVRKGDKAVGSFVIPDTDKYSRTVNCHTVAGSGATHKNGVDKKDLTLQWKAPSAGNYQIYVTVAENGGVFWARKPSQKIKIH